MTTFAEFSAQHLLTASELSELGYALSIVRGGCGTVSGREFKKAELLNDLREEARRQERAGARVLAEKLDIAHCELLAKYIADHERDQWRRGRNR